MKLKRVCSWCSSTLAEGDPGAQISHGICDPCRARMLANTYRDLERPAMESVDREWMEQIEEERRRLDWQSAKDFVLGLIAGAVVLGLGILAMFAL